MISRSRIINLHRGGEGEFEQVIRKDSGYLRVKSRYAKVLSRIEDLEKELNDLKAHLSNKVKDAIEKGRVEGINSFNASKEFQNKLVEFSEGRGTC